MKTNPMNAITMPEIAENIVIEVVAAAAVTSVMHDTQQVPLSKLVASTKNVRKRNAAMTIPELAASIEHMA